MVQLGLIGYPVNHSLSPWIHDQFLHAAQLTGTYTLHEINPGKQFSAEIKRLKGTLDGFNVTVPFKEKIIPYLDVLDESAKQSGAVNTVVRQDGKWKGFNTDGIGYVRSLATEHDELFTTEDTKVLIIGAGGAARGIYHALVNKGFTAIDMVNRTVDHAVQIAKDSTITTNIYHLDEIHDVIDTYDLLIQTTSVGMKPHEKEVIFPIHKLKPGAVASDIVYQPILTSFLQQAKKSGASIHYGHAMLLYQALYAFEIWTNQKISIQNLEHKLKEKLEGR